MNKRNPTFAPKNQMTGFKAVNIRPLGVKKGPIYGIPKPMSARGEIIGTSLCKPYEYSSELKIHIRPFYRAYFLRNYYHSVKNPVLLFFTLAGLYESGSRELSFLRQVNVHKNPPFFQCTLPPGYAVRFRHFIGRFLDTGCHIILVADV